MAKKTVASLQTKSKRLTKAIKMVKSPKTGAYTYVESIMDPSLVNEWLSCLLYTSPSPRDYAASRMPSSA